MRDSSKAVELEGKCLPFVFNQVLNQIRLEHRELIRVCQCFHDLAIRFRHRWQNIKLIRNLVWLHSLFLFVTHAIVPIEQLLVNVWIFVSEFEI